MSSNATAPLAHIRLVKLHLVRPPYALWVGVTGLQFSLFIWSDQLNRRGNLFNIQLLIEKGMKFLHGKRSGNIPHGKLPWPNALHVNPYKYLCCWVTEREPSTIMSSSSEYIHLGFIQQTISEEWNDGVSISNLRSNLLSLCIIKDNKIKGSDTTQSFTLLTTVTPFLVII